MLGFHPDDESLFGITAVEAPSCSRREKTEPWILSAAGVDDNADLHETSDTSAVAGRVASDSSPSNAIGETGTASPPITRSVPSGIGLLGAGGLIWR